MTINGFDELNTPKVQVEEPEEYFKKMDISPKQRKERVETSKELADVMLFLFALLAIEMQANKPNYPSVLRSFKQRFRDVVSKHSRVDDYVENYINEFTGGVFDTTRKYMEAAGVGMNGRTDAGWWTSVDRATAIGENQANIILNHEELLEAVKAGAVEKRWSNVGDNKVRNSHKEVIKKKIPLTEFFAVGKGIMLYPCDWDNNPDECFNCRCSAIYYDENGNVVKVGQNKTSVADKSVEKKDNTIEPRNEVVVDDRYIHSDGTVYVVDNKYVLQDHDDEEMETAKVLAEKYGKTVHLVPRVIEPQHIETPDYIIDGVRYDRKAIDGNGKHTVDSAIKDHREQAHIFIIAMRKTSLTVEEVIEQCEKIFGSSHRGWVEELMIEKDKKIIWEYKRKALAPSKGRT